MIFLFKSHFHTSRLQMIIYFEANYSLLPFHHICIKRSFLRATKAFLAKWPLVNTVLIPQPLTQRNCHLTACRQRVAVTSCGLASARFQKSVNFMKIIFTSVFPIFQDKLNACLRSRDLILVWQQLAESENHLPSLDMACPVHFVTVSPLPIITSGILMVPINDVNNQICNFIQKLQAPAFILKYIFLKTSKYSALKLEQVVSLGKKS